MSVDRVVGRDRIEGRASRVEDLQSFCQIARHRGARRVAYAETTYRLGVGLESARRRSIRVRIIAWIEAEGGPVVPNAIWWDALSSGPFQISAQSPEPTVRRRSDP